MQKNSVVEQRVRLELGFGLGIIPPLYSTFYPWPAIPIYSILVLPARGKIRSGADLNGDNLRICRAYLWINDHCMVRVMVRIRIRVRVSVADCCIQTAGESDKMRISHVIKTDQWCSPTDPPRCAFCHVPELPPRFFGHPEGFIIIIVVDSGFRRMPLSASLATCFITYTYYLHSESTSSSSVGGLVIIHKIIIFPIFI